MISSRFMTTPPADADHAHLVGSAEPFVPATIEAGAAATTTGSRALAFSATQSCRFGA